MSDATSSGGKAAIKRQTKSNGAPGKREPDPSDGSGGVPQTRSMDGQPLQPETLPRRDLLAALTALRKGDFSVRLPIHLDGLDGKIADAFNDVVDRSQKFARELERISRAVGKDGRIHERMSIGE